MADTVVAGDDAARPAVIGDPDLPGPGAGLRVMARDLRGASPGHECLASALENVVQRGCRVSVADVGETADEAVEPANEVLGALLAERLLAVALAVDASGRDRVAGRAGAGRRRVVVRPADVTDERQVVEDVDELSRGALRAKFVDSQCVLLKFMLLCTDCTSSYV